MTLSFHKYRSRHSMDFIRLLNAKIMVNAQLFLRILTEHVSCLSIRYLQKIAKNLQTAFYFVKCV